MKVQGGVPGPTSKSWIPRSFFELKDAAGNVPRSFRELKDGAGNVPRTFRELKDVAGNVPRTFRELKDGAGNVPRTFRELKDVAGNVPRSFRELKDVAGNISPFNTEDGGEPRKSAGKIGSHGTMGGSLLRGNLPGTEPTSPLTARPRKFHEMENNRHLPPFYHK